MSEFIVYFIFYIPRKAFFPSLPLDFFDLIVKVVTFVLIVSFCMFRYGNLSFRELIPTRQNLIYLIITLIIIFWIFGLFIGSERIRNPRHEIYKSYSSGYYSLSLLFIVALIPFFEEAIFRRYFLEIQRQHYSVGISILITSSIATLFHVDSVGDLNFTLLWTFFLQTTFGILYVKTRLGVSTLAHMFVNGLIMLLSI